MPDVQALSLRNAQKIVQVCFFNPSSFLNNDDDDDDDDDDDADDDVDEDDDDDEQDILIHCRKVTGDTRHDHLSVWNDIVSTDEMKGLDGLDIITLNNDCF